MSIEISSTNEELEILRKEYLAFSFSIQGLNEKSLFSQTSLTTLFQNLRPFDRPDMFAVIGKDIIGIEHFQFDGTQFHSHKGLKGIKSAETMKRNSQAYICNNIFESDFVQSYEIVSNGIDYQKNLMRAFENHGRKIVEYKQNLRNKHPSATEKDTYLGFFIENRIPPIPLDESKCMLPPGAIWAILSSNALVNSLDFILVGTEHQLSYFDKQSISHDELLLLKAQLDIILNKPHQMRKQISIDTKVMVSDEVRVEKH